MAIFAVRWERAGADPSEASDGETVIVEADTALHAFEKVRTMIPQNADRVWVKRDRQVTRILF